MVKIKAVNIIVIAVLILGLFFGCETQKTDITVKDSKQLLESRLNEYWKAVIEKNFDKAYNFEYPVFRKMVPKENYIKAGLNSRATYVEAEPLEIQINEEDNTALVKMGLTVKLNIPHLKANTIKIQKKEKWIEVDNVWYHVPGTNMIGKERG